jgi:heme exporter protein D
MELERFFAMGGYALYVWTSYGLVLTILAWNWFVARRRSQRVTQAIARLLRQEKK